MEEQGFSVRDRRIRHEDDASAPQPEKAEAAASAAGPAGGEDPGAFAMGDQSPAIDFSAFAFSLAHSALILMGLEPTPEGEVLEPNLEAARQNIDILAMLEEKTRGNLTRDEAEFIARLLYTLRMSFVEVSKARPAG